VASGLLQRPIHLSTESFLVLAVFRMLQLAVHRAFRLTAMTQARARHTRVRGQVGSMHTNPSPSPTHEHVLHPNKSFRSSHHIAFNHLDLTQAVMISSYFARIAG
jgi:hypothetical protein